MKHSKIALSLLAASRASDTATARIFGRKTTEDGTMSLDVAALSPSDSASVYDTIDTPPTPPPTRRTPPPTPDPARGLPPCSVAIEQASTAVHNAIAGCGTAAAGWNGREIRNPDCVGVERDCFPEYITEDGSPNPTCLLLFCVAQEFGMKLVNAMCDDVPPLDSPFGDSGICGIVPGLLPTPAPTDSPTPAPTPAPKCNTNITITPGPVPPINLEQCAGGLLSLTLKYTPRSCEEAEGGNEQGYKYKCEDFVADIPFGSVDIVTIMDDYETHEEVNPSDPFNEFIALENSGKKFPSEVTIEIYEAGWGGLRNEDFLFQRVTLHTSCSRPLRLGDVFGSLQVEGFTTTEDPEDPQNTLDNIQVQVAVETDVPIWYSPEVASLRINDGVWFNLLEFDFTRENNTVKWDEPFQVNLLDHSFVYQAEFRGPAANGAECAGESTFTQVNPYYPASAQESV